MSQVGRGGRTWGGGDRGSLLLLCVTPPSLHLLSSDRWSDAVVLHVLKHKKFRSFILKKNNLQKSFLLPISVPQCLCYLHPQTQQLKLVICARIPEPTSPLLL